MTPWDYWRDQQEDLKDIHNIVQDLVIRICNRNFKDLLPIVQDLLLRIAKLEEDLDTMNPEQWINPDSDDE